ncbi:GNAT family N-acetyltransferase [Siccirubricoccus deserti]
MKIRPEEFSDIQAIRAVVAEAFTDAPHSSGTETVIVDALRRDGALTISLVAEDEGEVIGHVAFSPVTIDGVATGRFGLGPVAVRSDRQRSGIGQALIARVSTNSGSRAPKAASSWVIQPITLASASAVILLSGTATCLRSTSSGSASDKNNPEEWSIITAPFWKADPKPPFPWQRRGCGPGHPVPADRSVSATRKVQKAFPPLPRAGPGRDTKPPRRRRMLDNSPAVLRQDVGAVALLTLNRPAARNSLSLP